MTDHPDEPPTQPAGEEPSAAPDRAEPVEPTPSRRRSPLVRALRTVLAIVVAIVAAVIVTLFTVDLGRRCAAGPSAKARSTSSGRCTSAGCRRSSRPACSWSRISMIEGLTPPDRPFLTAKKITVDVPWWTIFTRKLIIESVDMTDWDMVVETFPERPPQLSRSSPAKTPSKGPSRFTTTLRSRGRLAGRVHLRGSRHAVEHRRAQPERAVYRPPVATNYLGRASFSDGTVKIQSYEPFRTDMQSTVHDRRRHRALRPHGSDRRGLPVGRHRRRRLGALARADLSGRARKSTFPTQKRSSFTARSSRPPARAISPARSISSRAAAS